MRRRRWLVPLAVALGLVALAPSYVRAYRVEGPSDAPSFLVGDRILVVKAAYDIRLPYTGIVLLSRAGPRTGDVVMFRTPDDGAVVFKRVIGCPGQTVALRENRLEIDGVALSYEPVDDSAYAAVAERNRLGALVLRESGPGGPHLVSITPGGSDVASFEPLRIPKGHYFLMGDNRDRSRDSRAYGAVPRSAILGKVVRVLSSDLETRP